MGVVSNIAPVSDEVDLYRLVHPEHDVAWDDDANHWIVKSSAFQNPTKPVKSDAMSVVIGDTLASSGRPPEDARRTKPAWYVVALTAGFVRSEAQSVERHATAEEPAHGNVVGEKKPPRRRRFAQAARWVVEPPPPS